MNGSATTASSRTSRRLIRGLRDGMARAGEPCNVLIANTPPARRTDRLPRRRLHARHRYFKDADDVAVVLLLLDVQLPFDQDLVGAVAHGLTLRAVGHDHVLDLGRLSEAAGEQVRYQGELGD